MSIPGLLLALTRPKPPFSEQDYNKWYSEYHMKDVVRSGLSDLAIRYKNVNPDAKFPYLAVYRIPDMAKFKDESVTASIPIKHELLPEGTTSRDALESDTRVFVVIQKFDGPVPKEGPRGKGLRTVMIEPAQDGDAELDEWYRKQHLDMLSMVSGYRRSTRYKLVGEDPKLGQPRYLALHEWDDVNYPSDQVKYVTGTEWSKKVIQSTKKFEGELWEEITAYGATETKL